jgi:hypothetical protein
MPMAPLALPPARPRKFLGANNVQYCTEMHRCLGGRLDGCLDGCLGWWVPWLVPWWGLLWVLWVGAWVLLVDAVGG